MVAPSCPVLVIHDDDEFRKKLVQSLDNQHFSVTVAVDGEEAVKTIDSGRFQVILLQVNLELKKGLKTLEFLRERRTDPRKFAMLVIGAPDPEIRNRARWADETLLKPVDPEYVATRAKAYCRH